MEVIQGRPLEIYNKNTNMLVILSVAEIKTHNKIKLEKKK